MADEPKTGSAAAPETPVEKVPGQAAAENWREKFLRQTQEQLARVGQAAAGVAGGAAAGFLGGLGAEPTGGGVLGASIFGSTDKQILKGTSDIYTDLTRPKPKDQLEQIPRIESFRDVSLKWSKISTGLGPQVDATLQRSQDEIKAAVTQTYEQLQDRVSKVQTAVKTLDRNVRIVDSRTKLFERDTKGTLDTLTSQLKKLSTGQQETEQKFAKIPIPEKKVGDATPVPGGGPDLSDMAIAAWMGKSFFKWAATAVASGSWALLLGGAIAAYFQRQGAGGQAEWEKKSAFPGQQGARKVVGTTILDTWDKYAGWAKSQSEDAGQKPGIVSPGVGTAVGVGLGSILGKKLLAALIRAGITGPAATKIATAVVARGGSTIAASEVASIAAAAGVTSVLAVAGALIAAGIAITYLAEGPGGSTGLHGEPRKEPGAVSRDQQRQLEQFKNWIGQGLGRVTQPPPQWAPGAQQPTGILQDFWSIFGGSAAAAERPIGGSAAPAGRPIGSPGRSTGMVGQGGGPIAGGFMGPVGGSRAPGIQGQAWLGGPAAGGGGFGPGGIGGIGRAAYPASYGGLPPIRGALAGAPTGARAALRLPQVSGGTRALFGQMMSGQMVGGGGGAGGFTGAGQRDRMVAAQPFVPTAPGEIAEYLKQQIAGDDAFSRSQAGIAAMREKIQTMPPGVMFGQGARGIRDTPGLFGMMGNIAGALTGGAVGGAILGGMLGGVFGGGEGGGVPGFRGGGVGGGGGGGAPPTPALTPAQEAAKQKFVESGGLSAADAKVLWGDNIPTSMEKQPDGSYRANISQLSTNQARANLASQTGLNTNELSKLVGKAESGGDYNNYNRGTSGGRILPKNQNYDFSNMTVGEVMNLQALPSSDPRRVFAFGKYQMIPNTFKEAVTYLGLDPNQKLDANTQDRIFRDFLTSKKRPEIEAYISGKSDNKGAAIEALANEFASFGGVSGRGKYGGGNRASVSPGQSGTALEQARAAYQQAIAAGQSPADAKLAAFGVVKGTTTPTESQIAAEQQRHVTAERTKIAAAAVPGGVSGAVVSGVGPPPTATPGADATRITTETQVARPQVSRGTVTFEGDEKNVYRYGSGSPTKERYPSTPLGSSKITERYYSEKMSASRGIPIYGYRYPELGDVRDPKIGNIQRAGQVIHMGRTDDPAKLASLGCIAIQKNQWPQFDAQLQSFIKEHGEAYINNRPDGTVTITSKPEYEGSVQTAFQAINKQEQAIARGEPPPMPTPVALRLAEDSATKQGKSIDWTAPVQAERAPGQPPEAPPAEKAPGALEKLGIVTPAAAADRPTGEPPLAMPRLKKAAEGEHADMPPMPDATKVTPATEVSLTTKPGTEATHISPRTGKVTAGAEPEATHISPHTGKVTAGAELSKEDKAKLLPTPGVTTQVTPPLSVKEKPLAPPPNPKAGEKKESVVRKKDSGDRQSAAAKPKETAVKTKENKAPPSEGRQPVGGDQGSQSGGGGSNPDYCHFCDP